MGTQRDFPELIDSATGYFLDAVLELLEPGSIRDSIRITRDYALSAELTGRELLNLLKLTKAIEPFYDKIIALYLFKGDTLDKKKLNLVNPYPGREHFEMNFSAGVLNDEKGIQIPNNNNEYATSYINPFDLSDMYNQGFFYYTPDNPGGVNWVVGCVPDDGVKPWQNMISYHPRTGGSGNDYIELISNGYTYTSRRAAGFTSIRRDDTNAKININGVETSLAVSKNFSQNFYSTKNWAKIALIGGAGSAYRVSAFGVYQSLSDAEHEILRTALMQYLATENKL